MVGATTVAEDVYTCLICLQSSKIQKLTADVVVPSEHKHSEEDEDEDMSVAQCCPSPSLLIRSEVQTHKMMHYCIDLCIHESCLGHSIQSLSSRPHSEEKPSLVVYSRPPRERSWARVRTRYAQRNVISTQSTYGTACLRSKRSGMRRPSRRFVLYYLACWSARS